MSDITRKIAIHCLKSYSEHYNEMCEECEIYGQTGCDHCFEDVLEFAISSLETDEAYQLEYERTTKNDLAVDCISRVQAQTEIEMNASRYTIAKERGGMGQVEWSDQLIEVSDAVDIIRKLPTVTPQEPRWIPVSERLPEKNIEVLITTEWDCITIGEMFSNNDWFIHEGATTTNIDDIKAWMPLPQPYKAESEE